MNRDDDVTAVAEALHREACGYTNTHPCSADLTRANIAVAALEPYIAARITAETEALRREVERLRALAGTWSIPWRARAEQFEAERDEARAALAADRERLAAAVEAEAGAVSSRAFDTHEEWFEYRQGLLDAARIIRSGGTP